MDTNVLNLHDQKCEACSGDTPSLQGEELQDYHTRLGKEWNLVDDHHLEKDYEFKNFKQALDYTAMIGEMSEEEGHHPDIELSWGKVKVTVFTHAIDALSKNDFIWAAKADRIYEKTRQA